MTTNSTLSWTTDHYDQLCKKFADKEQECLALRLKVERLEVHNAELSRLLEAASEVSSSAPERTPKSTPKPSAKRLSESKEAK